MRTSRRPHVIRGFAAASVATFVALASHVFAGGGMPGMLGIAVPWLLSLMVCTLLAGRRLSPVRLTASVAISQLLFHALFVLGGIAPRTGLGPHEHGVPALPALADRPVGGPVGSPAAAAAFVPDTAAMWAGHAVAAALTVVLLYRGERIVHALRALASALAAWLGRPALVPARPHTAPRTPLPVAVPAPVRQDPPLRDLCRRGPPLRLV
ncbi:MULTISPECIES: hypothetical protein [Microbacterium]|uniref:hypothetical protein n=1 Tax=Microbacterium TaxID=33882 RepID=UPI00217E06D3|nr:MULTISPECIES: hypothetical protein [Microbacterium]UWF78773.1 hypothetical protein JSY13_11990 [Microbacterium neungamense]WCM56938.1 hypothetical protein JRG78_12000 [Microbacterium sp. EF45047]